MSKEALERIKQAEKYAHLLIEKAEHEAEQQVKDTEDKIFKERTAFYDKLKAERSEKLRRVDMQMKISKEKAIEEALQQAEIIRQEYNVYFNAAKQAAINTVLE